MSSEDILKRQDKLEEIKGKVQQATKLINEIMNFVDAEASDWDGVEMHTGHSFFRGPSYFVKGYCDTHNELDDAQAAVGAAEEKLEQLAAEAEAYSDECDGRL